MSRKRKIEGGASAPPPPPQLRTVKPITINQANVFKAFNNGQHVVISGYAGTGKSFIGMYLGLREVVREGTYDQLKIIRSTVPAREQGFLPGTPEEKAQVFEMPYRDITEDLFSRFGQYDLLKRTHKIDFESTSFLRGRTFQKTIILVDEAQNMTDKEINTIMTRVGEGSRVIVCGDYRQDDLKKGENSGFSRMLETVYKMPSFTVVEMQPGDIVRSGFVKEWILARENHA